MSRDGAKGSPSTGAGGGASRRERPSLPGYYGVPVIHRPHWKWLVVAYFFLGGIAGAAQMIAGLARWRDPVGNAAIVRAGRYLSLATLIPCPVLLVLDLGRPERFHRMLRVVKLRSPMSVGTWSLLLFGGASGLLALVQATRDGLTRPGRAVAGALFALERPIDAAGVGLGAVVGGYTGVLLAATAVPLWAKRSRWLGPLFFASALSSAAAAIGGALAAVRGDRRAALGRLHRLEAMSAIAEMSLLAGWLLGLGETACPVATGRLGRLLRHGTLGLGLTAPLALHALTGAVSERWRRPLTLAGSLLALAGGFLLRSAVVLGGLASADDPEATLAMTAAKPAHDVDRRAR